MGLLIKNRKSYTGKEKIVTSGNITNIEGSYFEIETGIIVVNGITYNTYKRIIYFGNLPSSGWKYVDTTMNAIGILGLYGATNDGNPIPFIATNDVTGYNINLNYDNNNGRLQVAVNNSTWSNKTALITIEYYK